MWNVNNDLVPKRAESMLQDRNCVLQRKHKAREDVLDNDSCEKFEQKKNQFGRIMMRNKVMLFSMILIILIMIIGFGGRVEAATKTCTNCGRKSSSKLWIYT